MSARLDQRLIALGLAPSRARAKSLIEAGLVRVGGEIARKPSQTPPADALVEVIGEDPCPWVSRAGLKLAHAIETFGLDFTNSAVLDIGASTGGFTQVSLHYGAKIVYAVDVGRNQLHASLKNTPKVVSLEGCDARKLDQRLIPNAPDWIVSDVSFIAQVKALPAALGLAHSGAGAVVLVKPQFEAGREAVGKGGLVKDPQAQARAIAQVEAFLQAQGWAARPPIESPVLGGDGNREFLLVAQKN